MKDIFKLSIFAGICIGIAGFGFLIGKQIGMFLFIFGLATVVSYGLKLFTGTAGFVKSWKDFGYLQLILIGNLIGCFLVAMFAKTSSNYDVLYLAAEKVLNGRLQQGILESGVQAIGCGILMTTSVEFARKGKEFGNWVPLLFAVPLFIHCGFPHCVADAFYYLIVIDQLNLTTVGLYCAIVIGNFIGCNIYRLFV